MTGGEATKLYGTEEATPEIIRLSAGPLSLDLVGGAVRYVRYAGHEAIRGIDYLVRDQSLRTPPARFTTVRREESPERFLVELDGAYPPVLAKVVDSQVHDNPIQPGVKAGVSLELV